LIFFWFFALGLITAQSETLHSPGQKNKQPERYRPQNSPPPNGGGSVRFFKGELEYQDSKGQWKPALTYFRADEAGTFVSQNGSTENYQKGDLLFKTQGSGWVKASGPVPGEAENNAALPNPQQVSLSEVERLVVIYTNEERIKRGLPSLEISESLQSLSRQKSANMARLRNLDHGVSPRPQGGENIAWNQKTAQEVVRTWMNSSGHRANILNRSYSKIGVGMAVGNGPYWTQMFQ